MTITEIESTLRELRARHQNLNEETLVTLLTAGGWEDKIIKEAVTLFRITQEGKKEEVSNPVLPTNKKEDSESIQEGVIGGQLLDKKTDEVKPVVVANPNNTGFVVTDSSPNESKVEEISKLVYYSTTGEEEPILQTLPDKGKELPKIEEGDFHLPEDTKIEEGQLVVQPVEINTFVEIKKEQTDIQQNLKRTDNVHKNEPPENLPLKPFEGTPHVWPFSKYKEVFHGETMSSANQKEEVITAPVLNGEVLRKSKIKRNGFGGEDGNLLLLTGITLLIILLLLAYMYSNGRL